MIKSSEARAVAGDSKKFVASSVDIMAEIESYIYSAARLGNRFVFLNIAAHDFESVIKSLRANDYVVDASTCRYGEIRTLCIGW